MKDDASMTHKKRFGQGNEVDRARPHFFHRDYWPLVLIRRGVEEFVRAHAEELRGRRALDLGSGQSPYAGLGAANGFEMLAADIDPGDASVIAIDAASGRVDLAEGAVDAVLSTQVLEHVGDVQAYLREAYRVLRPGGLMFC